MNTSHCAQIEQDTWRRQCLEAVQRTELAFLAIRDSLSDAQRQQLNVYIAACEDLAYCAGQNAGEF